LKGGGDIRKNFAMQIAVFVAFLPDCSLKVFQSRRFPVLIHEPVNVGKRAGGPGRGRESAGNIRGVFGFESTFCFSIKVFVRVDPSIRKQHIVDEADRRCCALNVEEDAFGHLPDNYAR
jgi:hypothetical protein